MGVITLGAVRTQMTSPWRAWVKRVSFAIHVVPGRVPYRIHHAHQRLELSIIEPGRLENGIDSNGGRPEEAFPCRLERGEDDPAIGSVGLSPDETLALETLHRAGDTRRVYLEAIADLAHGETSRPGEPEEPQDLETGEGEPQGSKSVFDPAHQDLLDPGDRGHRDHPGGGTLPPVRHPLAAGLRNRISQAGSGHGHIL